MTTTETLLWVIAAEIGFLTLLAGTAYILFAFTMLKDLIRPPKSNMPMLFSLPEGHPLNAGLEKTAKPEGTPAEGEADKATFGQYI